MADEIVTPSIEPPQVKLIAARGMALQMVIAQFAELVGLLVLSYCLCAGKLTEQMFGGLFVYCMTGNLAQKLRGKSPLPTTAVVGAGALWLVKVSPAALKTAGVGGAAALRHLLLVALAVGLVTVPGCGLFSNGGPALVQCASAPLPALLGNVVNILLGGSGPTLGATQLAELEQLGIKYGIDAVECAVKQAIADLTSRGAQATPEHMGAAERGRDYLRRKGAS